MTYNQSFNNGLGMPTTGFASRGKGSNIKRLSVAPPSKIATIDENQPIQPRTSRSHLLAGLRTAPKSPAVPASAPPHQLQQPGLYENRLVNVNMSQHSTPKTATSANFQNHGMNQFNSTGMNSFYTPEQVLAPPTIQMPEDDGIGQMDPALYEELVRTNQYLAEQQLRLQQQLINVTAAAQQFQNMNISQLPAGYGPVSPNTGVSLYEQQLQYGLQPVIEEVPNQPGVYTVYNPMTKQTSIYHDPNHHAMQAEVQHTTFDDQDFSHSPPPPTPTVRAQVSMPAEPPSSSSTNWRSNTPPKTSPSPPRDEPAPMPQSATFRHRKGLSLANMGSNASLLDSAPRTGGLKSSGLPPTPMTGTFGPGQAREGEHPTRQPRGPPSLEELTAKPTTKHEGSKNFASRQRRRAIHSLVRAGLERRGGGNRANGSMDSSNAGTPTSEKEAVFAASPDGSVRSGSASLSGQPSLGNLRANATVGAIGSERAELKERSRERGSQDSYTAASVSSDETSVFGGSFVEVVKAEAKEETPRRSKLMLLASTEKRRSQVF